MTRKLVFLVLPLALMLTASALAQTGGATAPAPSAPPAAAPAGPTKIGIINIQQAIIASNEGRRDLETLQKKFEPTRTKLEGSNKEIEGLKGQLNTQGDKLNDEARAKLVKDIEAKQKVLQRDYEDAQGDFQGQQNEILNRIGQKLMGVLDTYAKNNAYTVILDVSNPQTPVLWAAQPVDITRQVVEAYNAQSGVPAQAAPAAGTGATGTRPPAPAGSRPPAGGVQPKPPATKPNPGNTTTPR